MHTNARRVLRSVHLSFFHSRFIIDEQASIAGYWISKRDKRHRLPITVANGQHLELSTVHEREQLDDTKSANKFEASTFIKLKIHEFDREDHVSFIHDKS